MDRFEEYLNKADESIHVKRALTTTSYRNTFQRENHCCLPFESTNFELATYGDAILKVILCEIFLDKVDKLTENIKRYSTDKVQWFDTI